MSLDFRCRRTLRKCSHLFLQLHETYLKVCRQRQMTGIDSSEFSSLCTLVESQGIIGLKKAKEIRMNKVSYYFFLFPPR